MPGLLPARHARSVYITLGRSTDESFKDVSGAAFLVVAALIYVGFAVFNGASMAWTSTELGGVTGYGLVAWIGAARFPRLVGVGWLLHVLWDVALHPGGHPGFVPSWYPPLCLGFDVYVGVALLARFRVSDKAAFWDGVAGPPLG